MEQTWRRDEDGTYIVLMQSTEHPKAPLAPGSFLHWFHPVRAEVTLLVRSICLRADVC